MMEQIKDCFNKLERMEGILKEKVKGKVQKVGEILEGK